jgi:hypothetical protein
LKLVEFDDLREVVNERNHLIHQRTKASELTVSNMSPTLDIENFLQFQGAVLEKAKAFMKDIWHRGAILIIKKFKFLITKK